MNFRLQRAGLRMAAAAALALSAACSSPVEYDVVLRGGTIYDGGGKTPYVGDLASRATWLLLSAICLRLAERRKSVRMDSRLRPASST